MIRPQCNRSNNLAKSVDKKPAISSVLKKNKETRSSSSVNFIITQSSCIERPPTQVSVYLLVSRGVIVKTRRRRIDLCVRKIIGEEIFVWIDGIEWEIGEEG